MKFDSFPDHSTEHFDRGSEALKDTKNRHIDRRKDKTWFRYYSCHYLTWLGLTTRTTRWACCKMRRLWCRNVVILSWSSTLPWPCLEQVLNVDLYAELFMTSFICFGWVSLPIPAKRSSWFRICESTFLWMILWINEWMNKWKWIWEGMVGKRNEERPDSVTKTDSPTDTTLWTAKTLNWYFRFFWSWWTVGATTDFGHLP